MKSWDINPIDLLWDKLGRKAQKVCPTSTTHLQNILQERWPNTAFEKVVERKPRNLQTYVSFVKKEVFLMNKSDIMLLKFILFLLLGDITNNNG